MNIVATKLSSSMSKRQGYLSISDAMEPNLKSYTFSHCLKLKKDALGFTKWVLYWDDTDFVVVFTVITTVLSTGYIKATIIDRELTDVQTVGAYTGKNSFTEVHLVQGKYLSTKDRANAISTALSTHDFREHNTSTKEDPKKLQAQIDAIAESWGIKPKKS
ncbi:hypothetical protein BZF66_05520 [Salmonella enterica]|uniref:hypothetical protein n=1 Tax=Salmonella enterica TaxID=28901 RepID=UPI000FDFA032|nr:hypothetical protein CPT_Munch_479 [Salmonella phage Munch]EAZ2022750.1 hypothetical protein [Salmonella enterica]ECV9083884.1 hypothetical protein [Salmonella enterica subsp. enterica serovar Infantis]MCP0435519.1 hypothetical protein [Salmonella enterica subsp. enterica serovar Mbandaka]ECC6867542.1 hypothetical protein [Salmonella enterica]